MTNTLKREVSRVKAEQIYIVKSDTHLDLHPDDLRSMNNLFPDLKYPAICMCMHPGIAMNSS